MKNDSFKYTDNSCIMSGDQKHRFELMREWDKEKEKVLFITNTNAERFITIRRAISARQHSTHKTNGCQCECSCLCLGQFKN